MRRARPATRRPRPGPGCLPGVGIGSAARRQIAALHPGDEVGQPVRIGDAIAVGIGDDLAGRRFGADIARDGEPLIRLADDPRERKALGDLEGAVLGAVIDDDDLVIGIVESLERGKARLHRALGVVAAHHDRYSRVARQRRRQGPLVAARDPGEGGFRIAVAVDQAKRPILDQMAAGEPLVGPGEDKGARGPRRKGGADLPGEDPGLLFLALAHRIDAEFGQQPTACRPPDCAAGQCSGETRSHRGDRR